jgi:diguanylate cyclase (GGDEF)-like protein
MELLDIRTLFMADALVGLSLACVVFVARWGLPAQVRGVWLWAAGDAIAAVARVLYVVRDELPQMLGIVVPNSLLLGGFLLHYLALRLLFERRLPMPWALAAPALIVLTFVAAAVFEVSFALRVVLFTALAVGLCLACAGAAWQARQRSTGARVMVLAFVMMAAMALLRVIGGTAPGVHDVFAMFAGQHVSVLGAIVLQIAITVGYLLCLNETLRRELERLSGTDMLTGAYNRRGLLAEMARDLERARRLGHPVSLVMFDIDHFKRVNDERGHPAGDLVLTAFAELVTRRMRSTDLLARYGGEEFVLVLPGATLEEAKLVADRVRREVPAAALAPGLDGITVSAGVACSSEPGLGLQAQGLIAAADRRLYAAKRTRNAVMASDDASPHRLPVGAAV